jgi:Domain of unknown function (DUF5615)
LSRPGVGQREPARVALLLDEMHSPAVAEALRRRGHDVIAVAERPDLRAMADAELFVWAAQEFRRLVTENVKDFRRLSLQAEESALRGTALLYTSSRTFPRSRRNPGPLVVALDAWLCSPGAGSRPAEDWLQPA